MGKLIKSTAWNYFSILLIAGFLLVQIGCSTGGDDSVMGGDSGGSSGGSSAQVSELEVTTGSESIVANGSSQARISVTLRDENGDKVEDSLEVSFSTTAGDFNPSSKGIQSTTTSKCNDGVAFAMLTSSSNVGTATVTATVQGVNNTTRVNFVPSAVSQIDMSVSPSNLTANGVSTSTVSAFVTDSKDNTVTDGETISFRISGPGRLSRSTASTTNGVATVTYTASNDIGTATITATSTSGTIQSSAQISLIKAMVGSVSFTSSTGTLLADGNSKLTLSVNVLDTGNTPVDDGTAVNFTTTAGTFSSAASTLQSGGQTSNQSVIAYTISGRASVVLTSTTNVGVATVTATAGGITGTSNINFVAGIPNTLTVDASPSSLPADGASTSSIRAFVTDSNGNAVQTNEVISFFVTSGSGTISPPTATLFKGVASALYTAGKTSGNVLITAKSTSGISATKTIRLSRVGVGTVSLTAGSNQIVADGNSQTAITATVRDRTGKLVPDGTTVVFTTSAGRLSSGGSVGTKAGVATVMLTSSSNAGRATVTGTSEGFADSVTVEFVAGSPRRITLIASPETIIADGRSVSSIRADVTDTQGNPVADGEQVTFTVENGGGTVGPPVSVRTSGGVARTTFTANNQPGTATVRAETITGNTARVEINMTAPDVGSLTVKVDPESIVADGISQSVITATVIYKTGEKVFDGTEVTFTTTSGTFSDGSTQASTPTAGGNATIRLTSSTIPNVAKITARTGGISGTGEVEFTAIAGYLSLTTNLTSVKSDNSNFAEITATVLDANRVPITGVVVNFNTSIDGTTETGGQISASSAITDERGDAMITFSSGTVEKKNQTVVIEATIPSVPELGTRRIPIQIVGTKVELETTKTELETGDPVELVITVKDAGDVAINDAEVTITVSDPTVLSVSQTTGQTNVNGQLTIEVTGLSAGEGTVEVTSLGAYREQAYRVGSTGAVFRIIAPDTDPYLQSTNTPVTVEVLVPPIAGGNDPDQVRFATSLGFFTDNGGTDNVIDRTVSGGTATATFISTIPGVANIQVFNLDNDSVKDSMTIVVSAPSAEAAKIALQASSTVVAPSTGEAKNSVTLRATVKTISDQVVGGAAVAFSILNPTGGGETISPVIAFTDGFGVAITTFTSGFISSDSQGVNVKAEVIGMPLVFDQVAIVIGGTAGSIQIGRGSRISSINNNAAYSLPMVAVVSDANGNPVSGATVTLGNWPLGYAVGRWIETQDGCFPSYLTKENLNLSEVDNAGYFFGNEDTNRNLILDPGEDLNGDGQLTPASSSAGTLPPTVVTDENGVAEFNLVYAKGVAVWIQAEVSASTLVLGTETRTNYNFVLPALKGEECNLPNSPFTAQSPPFVQILTPRNGARFENYSEVTVSAAVPEIPFGFTPDRVLFSTTIGVFENGFNVMEVEVPVGRSVAVRLGNLASVGSGVISVVHLDHPQSSYRYSDAIEIEVIDFDLDPIPPPSFPDTILPLQASSMSAGSADSGTGGSVYAEVLEKTTDEQSTPLPESSGSTGVNTSKSTAQIKVSSEILNLPGLVYSDREAKLTLSVSDNSGTADAASGADLIIDSETGIAVDSATVAPNEIGVAQTVIRTEMPDDPDAPVPDDVTPEPWEASLIEYVNENYGQPFEGNPSDGLCSVKVYTDAEAKEPAQTLPIMLTGEPVICFDTQSFAVENGGSQTIDVLVCDKNLNPLTADSKVVIAADAGTLEGKTAHSYTDGNTIGPDQPGQLERIEFPIVISDGNEKEDDPPAPVTVTVTVEWEGVRYQSQLQGTMD